MVKSKKHFGLIAGFVTITIGTAIFGIYSIYHIFFKRDFLTIWNGEFSDTVFKSMHFAIEISLLLFFLSIFKFLRSITGNCLSYIGAIHLLLIWINCFVIVYQFWGGAGIITGYILGIGLGLVPMALISILFHEMWFALGGLGIETFIGIGSIIMGMFLITKSTKK